MEAGADEDETGAGAAVEAAAAAATYRTVLFRAFFWLLQILTFFNSQKKRFCETKTQK